MTYVDLVSVIMAMCPRTLLHVLVSTTEKSTNQRQQFPSQLFLAFTVWWWTTRGIRYGSPHCPVVVGHYSSFIPRLQALGTQSVCLTTVSLLSGHLRCCLLCRSYKVEE